MTSKKPDAALATFQKSSIIYICEGPQIHLRFQKIGWLFNTDDRKEDLRKFFKVFIKILEAPETRQTSSHREKLGLRRQRKYYETFLTHFMSLVSFYTILKTSENRRFSYVFRRYSKRHWYETSQKPFSYFLN